jgi:ribonuclease P protein subunit POP4
VITPKNVIRHELIGLRAEVTESSNKFNVGISGKVVDETKNTLVIKTKKGEKKIQKHQAKFMFMLNEKKVVVDGSLLVARPEDRVKKKVRKW